MVLASAAEGTWYLRTFGTFLICTKGEGPVSGYSHSSGTGWTVAMGECQAITVEHAVPTCPVVGNGADHTETHTRARGKGEKKKRRKGKHKDASGSPIPAFDLVSPATVLWKLLQEMCNKLLQSLHRRQVHHLR